MITKSDFNKKMTWLASNMGSLNYRLHNGMSYNYLDVETWVGNSSDYTEKQMLLRMTLANEIYRMIKAVYND